MNCELSGKVRRLTFGSESWPIAGVFRLSRGAATVGVDSPSKRVIGNFLKPSMYFAKDMDDALTNLTSDARWSD